MTKIEASARAFVEADAALTHAERIEHLSGSTPKHRKSAATNRRKAREAWRNAYQSLVETVNKEPVA